MAVTASTIRPAACGRIYADWGERLAAQGMAVLFPDSYLWRGLGPQCRVRARTVRPYRERVADAQVARTWLQTQDFVQKDRVGLLGWGNGGTRRSGPCVRALR